MLVVKVNKITMFLQDCRKNGGMQTNIAKSDAETFDKLLASVRKVKNN